MSTPDPERVQALAVRNDAGSLVAAAAARSAAQILSDARTPSAIHDATTQAVERFDYLLRAALGSAGTLDDDEC